MPQFLLADKVGGGNILLTLIAYLYIVPMGEYWKAVAARAFDDTCRLLRLGSRGRIVIALALSILTIFFIWIWGDKGDVVGSLPKMLVAFEVFISIFILTYIWMFICAPATMQQEAKHLITELQQKLNLFPKPPSEEVWINPHEAYVLASQLRGLDAKTNQTADGHQAIWEEFKQRAADGELSIRGRPDRSGFYSFNRPLESIHPSHWLIYDFKDDTYVSVDDEGELAAVYTVDMRGPGTIRHNTDHRFYDLRFRKADVERLFKTKSSSSAQL